MEGPHQAGSWAGRPWLTCFYGRDTRGRNTQHAGPFLHPHGAAEENRNRCRVACHFTKPRSVCTDRRVSQALAPT